MKRKRLSKQSELNQLLKRTKHAQVEMFDTERAENVEPELITKVPESGALSLGRPEGFHLSDVEKYLLEQVFDSFDKGALNELSPMQRVCFTDVVISGDTYDNVAARYHISRGAVQTHIDRAAARIRKVIRKLNG